MSSAKDVARDLIKIQEKTGAVLTLSMAELYKISGRERLRTSFMNELKKSIEEYGHIFGEGEKFVIVANDTNFSPRL